MNDANPAMRNNQHGVIPSDNGRSKRLRTKTKKFTVSVEEVNRVLEAGRLLFSVLTPKEIEELRKLLNSRKEE